MQAAFCVKMLDTLWQRMLPVLTKEFWAHPARAPMISRDCRHLVWGVCLIYIPLVMLLQKLHDTRQLKLKQGLQQKQGARAGVGPVLKAITCLWNVLLCGYCFAGFCALVCLSPLFAWCIHGGPHCRVLPPCFCLHVQMYMGKPVLCCVRLYRCGPLLDYSAPSHSPLPNIHH